VHPIGEQLEEFPQACVVKVGGSTDHLGRGTLGAGLDDLQELLGEARWQRFHPGRV